MRERNGMDLDGEGGDEEPGGAEERRRNCNQVILSKEKKTIFNQKGKQLNKISRS